MPPPESDTIEALRRDLLAWYDLHARTLPWRVPPQDSRAGKRPDPYHVWLSEIMLQQTVVVTVKPYFAAFLARYPTLIDLAAAPLDDVLGLWAGLGYYARARNLHEGAKALVARGGFPQTSEELAAIKGIGPYTSAAVASIAFNQPHVPVDGNVERVLSRLWLIEDALPAAKPIFRAAAQKLEHAHRPGDFAQALMDLGATICTPRNPACGLCPWAPACAAHTAGRVQEFPKKQPKKAKPIRYGVAYVHLDPAGLLVRKRPEKGLLGGMLEVPTSEWRDLPYNTDVGAVAGFDRQPHWVQTAPIRHVFTHFELRMHVWASQQDQVLLQEGYDHVAQEALKTAALPSLMQKIIASGLNGLGVTPSL